MKHLEMPAHFHAIFNFISPDHSHGHQQDSDYINEEGAPVEQGFDPDNLHYNDDMPDNDDVNDKDVPPLPLQLDDDQKRTVNVIRTYCTALTNCPKNAFIAPPHIFLTGPAGTGKSATITAVIDVVKEYADVMSSRSVIRHGGVYVTASTGAAAQQFDGGQTVHTAAGLKPDKRLRRITCLDAFHDKLDMTKLQKLQEDWQGVILMIIDEVSMVSANMLYALHLRLNLIFEKQNQPDVYFGGIGIILVGDLYQLKPVLASYVFEDLENCSLNLFRLLFHPIFLTTIHRQKGDLDFMHLLSRVRIGEQTDDDYQFLSSLHVLVNQKKYESYESVSHLFPTKKLTHEHNINRVPSPESNQTIYLFRSTDRFTTMRGHINHSYPDEPHLHDGKATTSAGYDVSKTSGIDRFCVLWVGAQVMLLKNVDTLDKLCNGSIGTVVGIEWNVNNEPTPIKLDALGLLDAQMWWYSYSKGNSKVKFTPQPLPANVKVVQMPKHWIVHFEANNAGVRADHIMMASPSTSTSSSLAPSSLTPSSSAPSSTPLIRGVFIKPRSVVFSRGGVSGDNDVEFESEDEESTPAPGNDKKKRIIRTGAPLQVCYAISIHKSQGMTRNKTAVHLGIENRSSLEGLAYVALSRVKKASGLIVLHIVEQAFKVSAKVKFEYARLAQLPQAGTVSNVLGNTVISTTPAEIEKRKNKRLELSLLAQFENETSIKKTSTKKASTKKKSSNSTAAVTGKKTSSSAKEKPNTSDTTKSGLDRDRLRNIPGESAEDRQRRLRRENRANKKLSAASVPLPSQVNATSASAVAVPLPPYFLGSLEPRRLQNLGNTCFINATLQCLFNCFSLLDYTSMPLGLIRDFFWLAKAVRGYLPASTDSPANQYGLLRFLPFFPLGGQQDAMDYLQKLFTSDTNFILTRQFEFTLVTSVMCGPHCREYNHEMNLPAPTHHTQDTLYTYLSVTVDPELRHVTLDRLLELFFRPEHLPLTYNCSLDSTLSHGSMKLTAWKTYPSTLLLQLGRFVFDPQTLRNKKNAHTHIKVPLVLSPDYSNVAIQYHLIGVVFHHGNSSTSGHYTACTFDKYNINGVQQERWNLHNDSSSTPISNMVQHLNRFCRDVYMLLYRRVT
jgi:hypothetical protein